MSSSSPAAPPMVFVFAASDPTGGAGVQADLLSVAAMGGHALTAITALTVQDTHGVERMLAIPPDWVRDQARRALDDIPVAAFKLGVLGSAANARAVAEVLAEHPGVPVVVDPVLASGRGDALAEHDAIVALREAILPRATVLTPNSIEARRLAGDSDLERCARRLLGNGCEYVLITGTHEAGADVVNRLYGRGGGVVEERCARLPGSYHGSGCTLASAVAAALARGASVPEAVHEAQLFTWHALAAGYRPSAGQFLPQRFFRH